MVSPVCPTLGVWKYLLHGFQWTKRLSTYTEGEFAGAGRFWWDLFQPADHGTLIQSLMTFPSSQAAAIHGASHG